MSTQTQELEGTPRTATLLPERQAFLERSEKEVTRWSNTVDTLVEAFHGRRATPPSLHAKIEALRNKRDTVVTKVVALKHHPREGWRDARRELEVARRELRDCWRSVIGTLDKEGLFV